MLQDSEWAIRVYRIYHYVYNILVYFKSIGFGWECKNSLYSTFSNTLHMRRIRRVYIIYIHLFKYICVCVCRHTRNVTVAWGGENRTRRKAHALPKQHGAVHPLRTRQLAHKSRGSRSLARTLRLLPHSNTLSASIPAEFHVGGRPNTLMNVCNYNSQTRSNFAEYTLSRIYTLYTHLPASHTL